MHRPCLRCESSVPPDADTCAACGASMVVAQDYRVTGLLRRERAVTVYSGVHARSGDAVTVTVSPPPPDEDARNRAEARLDALARLFHNGVSRVLAADIDDAGRWMVVQGAPPEETLQSRMERHPNGWDPQRGLDLLRWLLDTLEDVHRQDPPVVHGNLQPSNIRFRAPNDDWPVLTGWPLDGLTQRPPPSAHAPPEQVPGATPSPQWDLYAAGAVVLHAITGQPPDRWSRRTDGSVDATLLEGTDTGLRSAVLALTHLDPAHRPASARETVGLMEKAWAAERSSGGGTPLWVRAVIRLSLLVAIAAPWMCAQDCTPTSAEGEAHAPIHR